MADRLCEVCGLPHGNLRFCSHSCAASVTNAERAERRLCARPSCGETLPVGRREHRRRYCSNRCQQAHKVDVLVERWLAGEISGLRDNGVVTRWVKAWLRETRGDRCELCGWAEVNPVTGVVPVVADHIDGNWQNNRPENLRLLCPNCDSLQPTYMALNTGRGRPHRRSRSTLPT